MHETALQFYAVPDWNRIRIRAALNRKLFGIGTAGTAKTTKRLESEPQLIQKPQKLLESELLELQKLQKLQKPLESELPKSKMKKAGIDHA